jgi:hypothetical protein
LLAPLIKSSGEIITKQIEIEKMQSLSAEADRALELMGRAIRIAGYQHVKSFTPFGKNTSSIKDPIFIQKGSGFRGSDAFTVKYELSGGIDFDCIGNVLSRDRTKNNLALQGFLVDRQASAPKGSRVNGGSLICQSLDRHGRIQNTTLMNGVNHLLIEERNISSNTNLYRLLKVQIQMMDGKSLQRDFERTFSSRNL